MDTRRHEQVPAEERRGKNSANEQLAFQGPKFRFLLGLYHGITKFADAPFGFFYSEIFVDQAKPYFFGLEIDVDVFQTLALQVTGDARCTIGAVHSIYG